MYIGWLSEPRLRCYWCWTRRQRLVRVHRIRYNGDRDKCDRSHIQFVFSPFYVLFELTCLAELQGQDSAAVIGQMRDSLVDNWA